MITRFFKAIALVFSILFFLVIASSLLLLLPNSKKRRNLLVKWMHHCSRIILQILDVECWIEDQTPSPPPAGTLFLANHVSYVDALLLSAQYPSVFVTSNEVKDTFFLGWLARCAGCVFVERRRINTLRENISEIRKLLDSGFNVIIFPEGTTGDGSQILPFKKSLLEAAVGFHTEVRPICVNYRYCNGEAISRATSELLFYFGDMKLLTQLSRLLGVSEVVAELVVLPPISSADQSCRKKLAQASHSSISRAFNPILAPGAAL
jgi:1-acyl-sn-glycerol-3-phosphate acyltransferase